MEPFSHSETNSTARSILVEIILAILQPDAGGHGRSSTSSRRILSGALSLCSLPESRREQRLGFDTADILSLDEKGTPTARSKQSEDLALYHPLSRVPDLPSEAGSLCS